MPTVVPTVLTLCDRAGKLVFSVAPNLRAMRPWAWLVCLVLLAGPVGPGGAWHVATADWLSPAGHDVSVLDPAGKAQHVRHAGPSCLVCQALEGGRAVVPSIGALQGPPPEAVPALPASIHLFAGLDPQASTGRGPPLA
jgi:hypothetical protein